MEKRDPKHDDILQRLDIREVLIEAGYQQNRRFGLRLPSYVRLDGEGAADGRSGFPASNLKCRVRRYRAADRTARLPATLGDGLHGR